MARGNSSNANRTLRGGFDGPRQFLPRLTQEYINSLDKELPHLPTNLLAQEQDDVLNQVNDRLSQCAFDFVAKYQFPVPLTQDKRPVEGPSDREWTEWVALIKSLATKRRIPSRVIYGGQIKQLVTVTSETSVLSPLFDSSRFRPTFQWWLLALWSKTETVKEWREDAGFASDSTILENSLEMRHAAKHQSRPLKDDRNVLQLISAGTQVAKFLKNAPAMEYLVKLYCETEELIQYRKLAPAPPTVA
ncbi:uncharacterized protein PG998_014362 [Apiospora kogelbergensis]|uniref:uncharacterized protein n=1 Tax=Apiospora kogelbergensis TaxID=1337665 RepID=UPI00312D84CD